MKRKEERREREGNRERDTLPLWKKILQGPSLLNYWVVLKKDEKNSTRTKPFVLLSCSKEGWTNDEADKVAKCRPLGARLLKLN